MRRIFTAAGTTALVACLACWAGLAWGQPNLGKPAPTDTLPGELPPFQPPGGSGSAGPGAPAKSPAPRRAPSPSGTRVVPVSSEPGVSPAMPPGSDPSAVAQPLPAGPANPPAPPPGPLSGSVQFNEERQGEPSVTPDNTTGRQEPAVSLEWVGSPTAKVGQSGNYTLVVRNACNIPVQQVLVRVRVPNTVIASDTEPKATTETNVLVWELGTLQPKQEKSLQMKLLAEQKGDVSPQAWVTFTGSSVLRIKVREPRLALKATGPEKVMVGDPAAFTLTVSNPGDGSAEQVKIHATLTEGLEHARGPRIDFDIGNLAAGESRNVTLLCATKGGGTQKCEASAEAEGGLHAKESATVAIITPRLDLQLTGPALRYLGRKALYTLKVVNPGDAAASNVTVGDVVPEGFKVLAASNGGRHDFSTRTVSWFLGEVGPGQSREVQLEVQAINPGEFKHRASAVGARGLHAEAETTTRIEGLSALMLEMVDTEDPIEVNSETAYEVRITNTGSKVETDIKLVATIPDKMEFKSVQGPVRFHEEGKIIVFESLDKLAPKADAIFRINVKAVEAGTVRFKIQMTSCNLTEPVIKMEATRIYSDAPEGKPAH